MPRTLRQREYEIIPVNWEPSEQANQKNYPQVEEKDELAEEPKIEIQPFNVNVALKIMIAHQNTPLLQDIKETQDCKSKLELFKAKVASAKVNLKKITQFCPKKNNYSQLIKQKNDILHKEKPQELQNMYQLSREMRQNKNSSMNLEINPKSIKLFEEINYNDEVKTKLEALNTKMSTISNQVGFTDSDETFSFVSSH